MIGWLRRKRRHDGLFHFDNGFRKVAADPIQVWYQLLADAELIIPQHFEDLASADPNTCREATAICVRAARRVFNLMPIDADGHGMTDLDVLDVVNEYIELCTELKKNGRVYPTLFQPAERESLPTLSKPPTVDPPCSDCS